MAHITQTPTEVVLHFKIPKTNDLPARIVAAFVALYGPVPLDEAGQPAVTENEFTWQRIRRYVAETLRVHEGNRAANVAMQTASNAAEADAGALD